MVHLEMKRTRRELTETKAAWRDAELVWEASSAKKDAAFSRREAELIRNADAATENATRAVRERNAAELAADEARALVAELEARAFDARSAASDAAREATARAASLREADDEKRKAREAATARAVAAKDAQIETLTMEVRRLRHEVETARETASRATMGRRARSPIRDSPARAPNAVTSHDDDDDAGLEAFAAYVLGETGGGVDPGVRSKNENENKNERVRDRGLEPTTDVGSADVYAPRADVYAAGAGDAWDLGISSTLASFVDFFGGGAADAGRSEMTPAETTLGANAAAAADALLKARGTGESRA